MVVDGVENALGTARTEKLERVGMPGGGTRRGVVEGGVLSRVNRQRVDVDPPAPPCSDVMAMVETALAATTSRARGLLGSHMGALHADRCLPFYAFYLLASLPSQSAAALFCEQLCRYTSAVSNLPGIMEADSGALREENGVCTADSAGPRPYSRYSKVCAQHLSGNYPLE